MFVDESTIVLRDTGDIEWVKRGDPRRPRILQSMRAAVQVIGAVWRNGQIFTQRTIIKSMERLYATS